MRILFGISDGELFFLSELPRGDYAMIYHVGFLTYLKGCGDDILKVSQQL